MVLDHAIQYMLNAWKQKDMCTYITIPPKASDRRILQQSLGTVYLTERQEIFFQNLPEGPGPSSQLEEGGTLDLKLHPMSFSAASWFTRNSPSSTNQLLQVRVVISGWA